jgi:hypothetical protein
VGNLSHFVIFEQKLQEIAHTYAVRCQQFARCDFALLSMSRFLPFRVLVRRREVVFGQPVAQVKSVFENSSFVSMTIDSKTNHILLIGADLSPCLRLQLRAAGRAVVAFVRFFHDP